MPFKPKSPKPDFSSLVTSLDNSRTQLTNYSLYQTILFLITNTSRTRDLLVDDIATIDEQISKIFAGTFLTVNDETNDFANSRKLLAGTNITFDDTVAGERTVNASSGLANDYVTLSDGATTVDPVPINDGAGNFIYVGYTP